MGYQFLRKESTIFTTKTRFSVVFERILAILLVGIFDGDSFASQSKFDTYADQGFANQNVRRAILTSFKLKRKQWEPHWLGAIFKPTSGKSITSIHYTYNSCFQTNQYGMGNLCSPEICTNGSDFCSSTFFHSASVVKWESGDLLPESFLELHTLQRWKIPFCKIGDPLESQ